MATAAQAKRALAQFQSELCARTNVVGLGIVPADETQSSATDMAVAVYVQKKLPREKLKSSEVVPKELLVNSRSGKLPVPTRVIDAGGEFRPESV